MECPSCGINNLPDDIYCECGYHLKGKSVVPTNTKECPSSNCNFKNPREAIYCECGYRFKDILTPTKECPNSNCDSLNPLEAAYCKCGYDFMKPSPEGEGEELMKCPSCSSTQLTTNKQGYGWKKGTGVAVCTIGIGALAGFVNSNKIWITCLKCGHRWKAGKS